MSENSAAAKIASAPKGEVIPRSLIQCPECGHRREETMPEDALSHIARMHESGEINDEEYRKMKKIIAERTVERVKGE